MMYIGQKYLLLSSPIRKFKRKGDYRTLGVLIVVIQRKNKTKLFRGYVYSKESNLYISVTPVKGTNFSETPRILQLHDDYIKDLFERFRGNDKDKEVSEKFDFKPPPHLKGNSPLKSKLLKKISSLDHNHYAKIYVQKRRIPSDKHYLLYHTDSFKSGLMNGVLKN